MEEILGGVVIALFSALLGGYVGATRGQTEMRVNQARLEERIAGVQQDVKDLGALVRAWMRREAREEMSDGE